MTHIDLGIDEATYADALRVIGHPWRPKQSCNGWRGGRASCRNCSDGLSEEAHDIPIPAVTDDLLMRMLREGTKRCGASFFDDYIHYWSRLPNSNIEAAIIRATAALDKED